MKKRKKRKKKKRKGKERRQAKVDFLNLKVGKAGVSLSVISDVA